MNQATKNASMFLICGAIWGTNYWAYKFQIPHAPHAYSLFYRLGLAFLALTSWILVRTRHGRLRIEISSLARVIIFGILNFVASYYFLYRATQQIASGLVVVVFSSKCLITPILVAASERTRLDRFMVFGGFLGLAGISILLLSGETFRTAGGSFVEGLSFAFGGTLAASMGDIMSARNARRGVLPMTANFYALGTASIVLLLFLICKGAPLILPRDTEYWASLIWMSLGASLLAWIFYLELVSEVGGARASMVVLLLPVFGVAASARTNEFILTPSVGIGLLLVFSGLAISFCGGHLQSVKTRFCFGGGRVTLHESAK